MREKKFRLIRNGKIVGHERHALIDNHISIMHAKTVEYGSIEGAWKLIYPDYEHWISHNTKEQFTGLKDKKRTEEFPEGQEIYEGDIIEYPAWGGGKRRKVVNYKNAGFEIGANIYERREDINGEIIGNIHENPELM